VKRILLAALAILLTACLSPSGGVPQTAEPTPTATLTSLPTATASATPDPLDSLSPEVRGLVSEQEIQEILGSIENGSIEYVDYGSGSITEAQIILESFKAQETADWYFDTIVTAQAKDKDGSEFKVVWNKDENHWVRAERTHFKNIDQMVEAGDYNLVLLTQPEIGEPFPEGTEKAQYMIGITSSFGVVIDGKEVKDRFLKLEAVRDGSDFDVTSTTLMHSRLREAGFHKGVAPQKTHDEDFGITTDGKEIVLIPIEIQNGNGKNVLIPVGLDPLLYEYFNSPGEVDKQGITSFQNALMGNRIRFTPAFPTDNPDDWNNFPKYNMWNGPKHIPLIKDYDFPDNVIIELLKNNPDGMDEIFRTLPKNMQEAIRASMESLRQGGDPQLFFPFEGGVITDEFAKALSRNITEAILTNGFLEPAK
jgi:hypothetical protein